MQKVRVKKAPKKGDQVAFGLISNLVQPLGNTSGEKQVSSTMRAVPRDEANVEVEGGETVIGDTNNDGLMELFSFSGKRHSEGGMPVNLPPGSFIFSDTRKLKIKDKEVLTKLFDMPYKKEGYTPAAISKKYQINKYIETIKDKDADAISKRSASEMIKKNQDKLGILALVQESMKGFPDGIPSIAESVMAGLQGGMPGEQPQQGEQPQADFGGYMPLALRHGGPMRRYQVGTAAVPATPPTSIYSIGLNAYNTIKGLGNDAWNYEGSTNKGPDGKPVACVDCDIAGSIDWNNPQHVQDLNRLINEGYAVGTEADAKRYDDAMTKFGYDKPVYASHVPQQRYGGYLPKAQDGVNDTATAQSILDKSNLYIANQQKKIKEQRELDYQNKLKQEKEKEIQNKIYNYNNSKAILEQRLKSAKWQMDMATTKAQGTPIYPLDKLLNLIPHTKNGPSADEADILQASVDNYNKAKENYENLINPKSDAVVAPVVTATPAVKGATPSSQGSSMTGAPGVAGQQAATTAQPSAGGYASQAEYVQHLGDAYSPEKRAKQDAWKASKDYVPVTKESIAANPQWNQKAATTSQAQPSQGSSQPAASSNITFDSSVDMTLDEWLKIKRTGGTLSKYQKAGEVASDGVHKIVSVIKTKDGIGVVWDDGTKHPYSRTGGKDINTYDQAELDALKAKGIDVTVPSQIKTTTSTDQVPGLQHGQTSGVYGADYNKGAEYDDFKIRQAKYLKINPNFDPTKETDVDHFQGWYNNDIQDQAKAAGYTDPAEIQSFVDKFGFSNIQHDPRERDKKFGRYTWSRPTLNIGKKPEKPPGSTEWYYCDKNNVVAISAPIGETPTIPQGATSLSQDRGTTEGQCVKAGEELLKENQGQKDTWMMPDIVNFMGALSQKYAKTTPVQQKFVAQTPGYDLMDPTRQLAANQEQMQRMRSQAENTTAGNIGLASMMGASGQGMAQAADILANTERQNVGIVNQAYGQNAQIKNQEAQLNENARAKYVDDISAKQQADTLAMNTKNAMVRDAFNTGWSNFTKDQMMEKVLFPQVHTNNLTGEVSFSGKGRDYSEPDVYVNPLTGRRGSSDPASALGSVNEMRKKMIQEGWTAEGAEKFLTSQYGTKEETKKYGGRSGLLPVQPVNFNDYFAF